MLQQRSITPSQTYFKHTVYGLRFLLKAEGLPYSYLHLPAIQKVNKLPVVLSKQEVWAMLKACTLLKHKVLIGLLYGCGLRCLEVRSVKLADLDFDRRQLKVVQGKGKKDRYVPLSEHLIRGLKSYISAEKPQEYLFGGVAIVYRAGGDFDSRYSQKSDRRCGCTVGSKRGGQKSRYYQGGPRAYAQTHLRHSFVGGRHGYNQCQKLSVA